MDDLTVQLLDAVHYKACGHRSAETTAESGKNDMKDHKRLFNPIGTEAKLSVTEVSELENWMLQRYKLKEDEKRRPKHGVLDSKRAFFLGKIVQ